MRPDELLLFRTLITICGSILLLSFFVYSEVSGYNSSGDKKRNKVKNNDLSTTFNKVINNIHKDNPMLIHHIAKEYISANFLGYKVTRHSARGEFEKLFSIMEEALTDLDKKYQHRVHFHWRQNSRLMLDQILYLLSKHPLIIAEINKTPNLFVSQISYQVNKQKDRHINKSDDEFELPNIIRTVKW